MTAVTIKSTTVRDVSPSADTVSETAAELLLRLAGTPSTDRRRAALGLGSPRAAVGRRSRALVERLRAFIAEARAGGFTGELLVVHRRTVIGASLIRDPNPIGRVRLRPRLRVVNVVVGIRGPLKPAVTRPLRKRRVAHPRERERIVALSRGRTEQPHLRVRHRRHRGQRALRGQARAGTPGHRGARAVDDRAGHAVPRLRRDGRGLDRAGRRPSTTPSPTCSREPASSPSGCSSCQVSGAARYGTT